MLRSEKLINESISGLLNSYSMVFFSKNRVLAAILILVSFFDIYAGISGLLSVLVANLSARFLGLNHYNISSGFYGFNALLVGMGLGMAIQPSIPFFIILPFIALATLLLSLTFEGILGKYGLPFLTVPFLLAIWLAELAFRSYAGLQPSESGIFTMNTMYARGGEKILMLYNWFGDVEWPLALETYFKSLGAIFFQYHLLAGIFIAAGLLIYSRIAFLLSILGFGAAWYFYLLIGANMHELDYGFIGFNHILTAIALGGFFMIASKWSLLWVLILTPVVTLIITGTSALALPYQLTVYSLPFNIVVLVFLYAMKFRERMLQKPETVIVQHFSPEENLYAGMNARERFRNQNNIAFGLPFYGTWYVNQGHSGKLTHRDEWKNAWDFVVCDEGGLEFSGDGSKQEDYFCFGKPVLAPADGWIEEVVDMIDDNMPGDYNLEHNWGNTLVIKHAEGIYSKLSHLKKQSILFARGTFVYKGQVIAHCGNSGRSPFPHLHFQFQTTPFIGSKTLLYPFSQFVISNSNFSLRLSGIPEEGQNVQNIEAEPSLTEAFNFVPGQVISFIIGEQGTTNGEWLVKTDMLNNRYLECQATSAKAYFRYEGRLFYFTWFEGSKKSLLYHFYLAAYKVPLGFYKNMPVEDVFPPTILRYGSFRFLQDIVSPFVLFLKPSFKLIYRNRETLIAGSRIELYSECRLRVAGKDFRNWSFVMQFADNQLKTLEITTNHAKHKAIFKHS
ncbi:MAG: peptidoglycan DD-metalloendopeptidase family protein [Lentimicrobium sp.]|nr:peptidoglycan DD-metalloendopeptidase family protein [Lentimicrobium sp.]